MMFGMEVAPLSLDILVRLHLHLALAPFYAVLIVPRDEVVEHQGVDTFRAVFGQHADHLQVDDVRLVHLQSPQHMPPAEGQQSSATAFLQGFRQRGDGDTHAHQLVLVGRPVLDDRDEVQVGVWEIHVDILVYLSLRQFGETVKIFKGVVDKGEYLMPHASFENLFLGELADAQVVAFHDHLRDTGHLLRHLFRNKDLELHIVVVLLPASQLLHVPWVVGIVIDGGHRSELLETLGEHSLGVEVGEAQRADHLFHSVLPTVVFDGFQQGAAHLHIVDEIDPSEAHTLPLPLLVGLMVDDGSHAAHHLSVLVGQEVFGLTEVEGGVLLSVQRRHVVAEKRRHIVRIAFIKVVMKLHEPFQVVFTLYFSYFYSHIFLRLLFYQFAKVARKSENSKYWTCFSSFFSD